MSEALDIDELSQFYNQLATLDSSGLTVKQIFDTFAKNERNPARLSQLRYIATSAQQGKPLSQSLHRLKMVPEFDIPLIAAAEEMGRVPEFLKKLSSYYHDMQFDLKSIQQQMLQPFFTLMLAILSPDFPQFFVGTLTLQQYLKKVLPPIGIVILVVAGIYMLWRSSVYSRSSRLYFLTLLSLIPGLRSLSKKIAIEKFCMTFELSLASGVDLYKSLDMAAASSGREDFEDAAKRMVPMLKNGLDLVVVMNGEDVFPNELVASIRLGLQSGELPEFINKYQLRLSDEIDSQRQMIVKFFPKVIYLMVSVYVGWTVIKFYQGHFDQLNDALNAK